MISLASRFKKKAVGASLSAAGEPSPKGTTTDSTVLVEEDADAVMEDGADAGHTPVVEEEPAVANAEPAVANAEPAVANAEPAVDIAEPEVVDAVDEDEPAPVSVKKVPLPPKKRPQQTHGKGKYHPGYNKRHKAIPRIRIAGNAFRRLARRAGIKRLSPRIYLRLRELMETHLKGVLLHTIIHTDYFKRKTISTGDVIRGLESRGLKYYGA